MADSDHDEKGGWAEGFHQVGGCEGRGDGACGEPEHKSGGELDTLFGGCKVMGVGSGDRVDREGCEAEEGCVEQDACCGEVLQQGC